MRITTKLNIGILAVFAISVFANYSVFQLVIKPQFDAIEMAGAKLNHKRVLDALEGLQAKLRNSSQDWAFWDDSYDFVRGENVAKFTQSNLAAPEEMLNGLGIELLIFVDSNGSTLWGEAIDLSSKEKIPDLVDEVKSLEFKHPPASSAREANASSGLIKTSKGLVLVAAAPILKSDRTGAPAGMIWMGYRLHEADVQDLTGVKFQLEELAATSPTVSEMVATNSLASTVSTSSLIMDIKDRPLVVLRAETPRDVSAAGTRAINSAIWLSVIAGFVLMLSLWYLVRRIVVTRLIALKEHFGTAGETGRLKYTQQINSNDEIGQLANSFDGMADQVNHLRDALADSSYLSGMSEWAAGTLHNVRNGLTPINTAAWKAQSLFETSWVANLKSALEQIESPDTPPERREKFRAYIISKAPHILHCAEQVKVTSQEIASASKAVADMVSGYENFSRREIALESIDLLPFTQEIAKVVVLAEAPDVHLSLPSASATIVGNRTILRQILANILNNSIEAMEGQGQKKRIVVDWQAGGIGNGNLRLSITDNGEGITPEIVKSIFERGFSTRRHKVGGLGLHWCANAARKLGGSLTAESSGPGAGAKFVLCLPTSLHKLDTHKEVA